MEERMSNDLPVDAVALREEVKSKYRSVAVDPHGNLSFPYGTPTGATPGLRRNCCGPNA